MRERNKEGDTGREGAREGEQGSSPPLERENKLLNLHWRERERTRFLTSTRERENIRFLTSTVYLRKVHTE